MRGPGQTGLTIQAVLGAKGGPTQHYKGLPNKVVTECKFNFGSLYYILTLKYMLLLFYIVGEYICTKKSHFYLQVNGRFHLPYFASYYKTTKCQPSAVPPIPSQ